MSNKTGISSSQLRKFSAYLPGGITSIPPPYGQTANITKFLFVAESRTVIPTQLQAPKRATAGFSNSGTAGYTSGGESTDGSVQYSQIERLLFSVDSNSLLSTTLSATKFAFTGAAHKNNRGFVFGGYQVSANTNRIERLLFSNETISTISATLTSATNNLAASSNDGVASYISGGSGGLTRIDKLLLSNETKSTLSATITGGNVMGGSAPHINICNYVTGGQNRTAINKLSFSTETNSLLTSGLVSGRTRHSVHEYSNLKIYSMGGLFGTNDSLPDALLNSIESMSISTETSSLISTTLTNGGGLRQAPGFANNG